MCLWVCVKHGYIDWWRVGSHCKAQMTTSIDRSHEHDISPTIYIASVASVLYCVDTNIVALPALPCRSWKNWCVGHEVVEAWSWLNWDIFASLSHQLYIFVSTWEWAFGEPVGPTYVLTIPFCVQKHKTQIPFRLTISFPVKEFVPTWINCSFIWAKAKDYRMRCLLSYIRSYLRCILRRTARFIAIQFKLKWMSDQKAHVTRVWFYLHQNSEKMEKKKYERFLMGMPHCYCVCVLATCYRITEQEQAYT